MYQSTYRSRRTIINSEYTFNVWVHVSKTDYCLKNIKQSVQIENYTKIGHNIITYVALEAVCVGGIYPDLANCAVVHIKPESYTSGDRLSSTLSIVHIQHLNLQGTSALYRTTVFLCGNSGQRGVLRRCVRAVGRTHHHIKRDVLKQSRLICTGFNILRPACYVV